MAGSKLKCPDTGLEGDKQMVAPSTPRPKPMRKSLFPDCAEKYRHGYCKRQVELIDHVWTCSCLCHKGVSR